MRKNGFTLIELLVVIAIIGILITLGINTYIKLQKNGRDARRMSDLAVIQSALEQYHADQHYYPDAIASGITFTGATTKTYLTVIPSDPSYIYIALPNLCTNCTSYSFCAKMENTANASVLTNCTAPSTYEVRPP